MAQSLEEALEFDDRRRQQVITTTSIPPTSTTPAVYPYSSFYSSYLELFWITTARGLHRRQQQQQ